MICRPSIYNNQIKPLLSNAKLYIFDSDLFLYTGKLLSTKSPSEFVFLCCEFKNVVL